MKVMKVLKNVSVGISNERILIENRNPPICEKSSIDSRKTRA